MIIASCCVNIGCSNFATPGRASVTCGITCGITCIDLSPIAVPRMRDRLAEQGTSDKFTDMVDSLFPSSVHAMLPIVTRLLIHQAPYCGYIVCSSYLPSWEKPCTEDVKNIHVRLHRHTTKTMRGHTNHEGISETGRRLITSTASKISDLLDSR